MANITHRGVDKSGKDVWLIRVFVDGRHINKTFHGTEKKAEQEAARLELSNAQGEPITQSKMKTEEFLDEWMETYQKPEILKFTFYEQTLLLNNHIKPFIGSKRMNALNPMDCQKVINRLAIDQKKTRTAVMAYNLMKKAFRQAVVLGYLIKNPMDAVKKPKDQAKERPFLTVEQASFFFGIRTTGQLLSNFSIFVVDRNKTGRNFWRQMG